MLGWDVAGQSWLQLGELSMAFVLSAIIGAEREMRHKSAGLRTYTLVGVSSALIMLVSKYGFSNILVADRVVLDPSRIAAQIVTGIGFIGGGLIFVRRDNVRGLTTAAIVWLTAAVGMACGAGLPILALAATAAHFVIVFGFPYLVEWMPRSRWTPSLLQVSYIEDAEVLRNVMVACTQYEFSISRLQLDKTNVDSSDLGNVAPSSMQPGAENAGESGSEDGDVAAKGHRHDVADGGGERVTSVLLHVQGTRSVAKLAVRLSEIKGVVAVKAGDVNVTTDI